jgi:hypothetical protein
MRIRRLVLLPLTVALVVGPAAGPAFAKATAPSKAVTAAPTKKAAPVQKPTAKPTPTKKPSATPFSATGTLLSVDPAAATVTLQVRGGKDKSGRGTALTVKVAADAKVNLNDAPTTLSALPAGAHVAVLGTVTGSVTTVTKVNASTVSDDPTATPTASPTSS